ncbi:hypothetical protein L9F63_010783, partial [Diploptera punctata]
VLVKLDGYIVKIKLLENLKGFLSFYYEGRSTSHFEHIEIIFDDGGERRGLKLHYTGSNKSSGVMSGERGF